MGREELKTMRTYKMRRRRVVLCIVFTLGIVLTVWIGSLAWNAIDEGAVPSDSAFQPVPPPSEIRAISTQCGSGGCWREMVVEINPPHTAHSLAAEMGLSSERCEPMNLWTLRQTCSGVSTFHGEGLNIYLGYSR